MVSLPNYLVLRLAGSESLGLRGRSDRRSFRGSHGSKIWTMVIEQSASKDKQQQDNEGQANPHLLPTIRDALCTLLASPPYWLISTDRLTLSIEQIVVTVLVRNLPPITTAATTTTSSLPTHVRAH